MNGNNLFVDTNILLYLLKGDTTVRDLLNQKKIFISFITEIELLSFKVLTSSEKRTIKKLLSDCTVIGITSEIKNFATEFRLNYYLKIPDAIIAGTAAHLIIPLVTADKHFKTVKELDIILYQF